MSNAINVQETIQETGYELGVKAFNEGKTATPAHDDNCIAYLAEVAAAGESILLALDGWTRGWHQANINAPLEDVK